MGQRAIVSNIAQWNTSWVEVATDYLPSRAAINIDADSWLQQTKTPIVYITKQTKTPIV